MDERREPDPQHTYRFCKCGRRLRAGERCDETYDGHKPPSEASIAAMADGAFDASVREHEREVDRG